MIGVSVGQYRIVAKLGEGGMGIVYLAEHSLIGRQVAIKVLRPEQSAHEEHVARFFTEARSLARLKHPGLVEVYDFGYLPDGGAYLVMERLEGETVGQRLDREGRLPHDDLLVIARQVVAAVGAAHALGIIHRDLKPDNILLIRDPVGEGRVKVVDFGIAKLLASGEAVFKTLVGSRMGTPLYMSPEQCRGAASVDARADVYSIGCVLYEMVCGRPPFVAENPSEVMLMHLSTPPAPLRTLEGGVHPGLEELILRCLRKTPDERPSTMQAVADALAWIAAAAGPPPGARPSPRPAPAPLARVTTLSGAAGERRARAVRPTSATLLGFGLLALLVALGVPAMSLTRRAEPTPLTVAVSIETNPSGAAVFRASTGAFVGMTPCVDRLPRGPGRAAYRLALPGYEDEAVTLPLDRDGQARVKLTPRAVPAPPPLPPIIIPAPVRETTPTAKPRHRNASPPAPPPVEPAAVRRELEDRTLPF